MDLVNKVNLRFLILLIVVFTVAGVALYFAMGYVVTDNIDEILESRALKVTQSLTCNPKQGSYGASPDQSIEIDYCSPRHVYKVFSDTAIYDTNDKELIGCRKLTFITKVNDQYYKVQIILSRLETEDMIQVIFYFMISLFTCIVIALFFLNKRLSSGLWSPFFKTLHQLKSFKAGQKNEIVFEKCSIKEFSELNMVLNEMINKIQSDFNNLKEFTENASHELQTPLAIIKTKLETVLQCKSLPHESQGQVQIAYQAVTRLSKLNEALLLLSKIENRQFPDESMINLCELIADRVAVVEDMLSLRQISITLNLDTPFQIRINPYLADILINNLLSNAIRHNVDNGKILIDSFGDKIVFSNTGKSLDIEPEKIFQRFVKQKQINESNGLGLSIAYEICKNSNLELEYNNQNALHNFILSSGGQASAKAID
jgi:signal transduction histidine kinase